MRCSCPSQARNEHCYCLLLLSCQSMLWGWGWVGGRKASSRALHGAGRGNSFTFPLGQTVRCRHKLGCYRYC